MRQIVTYVYDFDELSGEAKKKALEWYRNRKLKNDTINDQLVEVFNERLIELGYGPMLIEFSLSYSQGDGVAFYGRIKDLYILPLAKRLLDNEGQEKLKRIIDDIYVEVCIKRNSLSGRYSHSGTMDVSVDFGTLSKEDAKFLEDFENKISLDVKQVSSDLEDEGYKLSEGLLSDSTLTEEIMDENFEFDIEGNYMGD